MTASDFSGLPSNSNWASPKASNNTASKPIGASVATRNASALEKVDEYFKNECFTLETLGPLSPEQTHEHFMLSRPKQSYIVRTLIEYISTKCVLTPRVTAVDLGSSLTLAVEQLLYNLRDKDLGLVLGFAGSVTLNRVGDLIIPHPIAGSSILESACVKPSMLPSGTCVSIGRGGANVLNLKTDDLASAPPSIVPRPEYRSKKPDASLEWNTFRVKGRDGLLHPVVWDGVLDKRVGVRALVLFRDGSTSLVRITQLLWSVSKSPIFVPTLSNQLELDTSLTFIKKRMYVKSKACADLYDAYSKPLLALTRATTFDWSLKSDVALVDFHFKGLRRKTLSTFIGLPPCIWSKCAKDSAQGLCPSYGGRKAGCCRDHYVKAIMEGFIHPGLITPGTVLVPGSTFKRHSDLTSSSNVKRHVSKDGTVTTSTAAPSMCVDDELNHFEYILNLAEKSRLPAKWMKAAEASNSTATFLSIFDGDSPDLNTAAKAFGFDGLPPVDIASAAPLDL